MMQLINGAAGFLRLASLRHGVRFMTQGTHIWVALTECQTETPVRLYTHD